MPVGPTAATARTVATGDVMAMRSAVAVPPGMKPTPMTTSKPQFHARSFANSLISGDTVIVDSGAGMDICPEDHAMNCHAEVVDYASPP